MNLPIEKVPHITTEEEKLREEFHKNFGKITAVFNEELKYYQYPEMEIVSWWLPKLTEARIVERKKAFWTGYDAGVSKQIEQEYLSPAEANELFSLRGQQTMI